MRPIDADAFKKYIDAQEGRPFIGCTVGEAMKILIDEQPTIQPEKAQLSREGTTFDLISRQAAIEAMEQAKEQYFDRIVIIGRMQNVVSNLPPAQPEPQWIPVERELPEEQGYYITSNEYGGVIEDFYCDDYFWIADRNAYKVIAWMPKPEPYKPNK